MRDRIQAMDPAAEREPIVRFMAPYGFLWDVTSRTRGSPGRSLPSTAG